MMIKIYGKEFEEVQSRDAMIIHFHKEVGKRGFRGNLERKNIGVYRVDRGSHCNKILGIALLNVNRYFVEKKEEKMSKSNMIKAYYNADLIGEGDGRDHGVEIYKEDTEEVEYEFFAAEQDALKRAEEISEMETSSAKRGATCRA